MPQNEVITITDQSGTKMSIEVSWEDNIWAWAKVFRVILKWLEFPERSVDKILPKDSEIE